LQQLTDSPPDTSTLGLFRTICGRLSTRPFDAYDTTFHNCTVTKTAHCSNQPEQSGSRKIRTFSRHETSEPGSLHCLLFLWIAFLRIFSTSDHLHSVYDIPSSRYIAVLALGRGYLTRMSVHFPWAFQW
jgi:hypothetical protein